MINNNTCIYHPNINIYQDDPSHPFYHIWNGQDNLINYATIIENASELYLIDSSFFCLAINLNLKAHTRVVYALPEWDYSQIFKPGERDKWIIKSQ